MTDIESQVFTRVDDAVTSAFPAAFVSGTTVDAPPQFPCVYLEEKSNTAYTQTRSSTSNDNHAILMYQVDIYSAKANGRKSEAKSLRDIVDRAMQGMGFTRTMCEPVPNTDSSVYRITARYQCIVGTDETIYRR